MASLRSRLWRLRRLVLVGSVFLASAAFFWWRLPPTPRFTITGDPQIRVQGVSPDGYLLAIARDGQIQLWCIATGKKEAAWPVPDLSVEHAVFTADSRRLVANCFDSRESHVARIYRVGAEQVEAVLPLGHWIDHAWNFLEPHSFLLSLDGGYLAYLSPKEGRAPVSHQCVVKVWDVKNAREQAVLGDSGDDVLSMPLAFSPDSRFLALGISREREGLQVQVKVWEASTGRLAHTLTVPLTVPHQDRFHYGCVSLAFTPDRDGLLGFVSSQRAGHQPLLLCWELGTERLRKSRTWEMEWGSPGASVVLRLTLGGKRVLIQGLEDLQTAYLCDLTGPDVRMVRPYYLDPPQLTHDGTHLTQRQGGLYTPYGKEPKPLDVYLKELKPLGVILVDLASLKETEVCRTSWWRQGNLTPMAFSTDDRTLAVDVHYWLFGDQWYKPVLKWLLEPDRPIHLYDVNGGGCVARLPGMPGTQVIFTPDGKAMITYARVYRTVAFTKDGKPVYPEGDFAVRVYDSRTSARADDPVLGDAADGRGVPAGTAAASPDHKSKESVA